MTSFTVVEKTPAEWAEFINSIPDREARQAFMAQAITDAYKAGYRAGISYEPGCKLPWE